VKPMYVQANNTERERLHSLGARLTDDDLRRRLDNGMTIATVLLHLAFWDEYCRALLEQWEQPGFTPPRTNFEAVNAAIRSVASAVPERTAVKMALAAADAVDQKVEALRPDAVTAIEAAGSSRLLERALHRRGHLDQIDSALAKGDSRADM